MSARIKSRKEAAAAAAATELNTAAASSSPVEPAASSAAGVKRSKRAVSKPRKGKPAIAGTTTLGEEDESDQDYVEPTPPTAAAAATATSAADGGESEETSSDSDADDQPARKKTKAGVGGAKKPKKLRADGSEAASAKGTLRYFSQLVCEKLAALGTSSYKEIADQLVTEAAASKNFFDDNEKNIRRRIYDALNVLLAMGVITKLHKSISWRGFGDVIAGPIAASVATLHNVLPPIDDAQPIRKRSRSQLQKGAQPDERQQLRDAIQKRQQSTLEKRAALDEWALQYCGIRALIQQNRTKQTAPTTPPPMTVPLTSSGVGGDTAATRTQTPTQENGANTMTDVVPSTSPPPRILYPFMVMTAPLGTPVSSELDDNASHLIIQFDNPFTLTGHQQILETYGAQFARSHPTPTIEQATQAVGDMVALIEKEASLGPVGSPFDHLVSAAAASPKLKPHGAPTDLLPSIPSMPTAAAAAAAAESSSLLPASSTSSPDPRAALPYAVWSLLPRDSVLSPARDIFMKAHQTLTRQRDAHTAVRQAQQVAAAAAVATASAPVQSSTSAPMPITSTSTAAATIKPPARAITVAYGAPAQRSMASTPASTPPMATTPTNAAPAAAAAAVGAQQPTPVNMETS